MTQPRGRDREPPQDPPVGSKPSLDSHYGSGPKLNYSAMTKKFM